MGSSAVYKIHYPDMNSSEKEWKKYFYQVVWARVEKFIAAHNLGEAIELFETSVFPFWQNYEEKYAIGRQAKIEKAVAKIMEETNEIQDDFNKMKGASEEEAKALAKDALEKYYGKGGIKDILEKSKGLFEKEFIDSIEEKFDGKAGDGPIFGKGVQGVKDFAQLSKYWQEAWKTPKPVPPKPTNGVEGDEEKSATLQIIQDGFHDVTNALSSQNSTVQAREKYYTANDQRIEAAIHFFAASITGVLKQAVGNQRSN